RHVCRRPHAPPVLARREPCAARPSLARAHEALYKAAPAPPRSWSEFSRQQLHSPASGTDLNERLCHIERSETSLIYFVWVNWSKISLGIFASLRHYRMGYTVRIANSINPNDAVKR